MFSGSVTWWPVQWRAGNHTTFSYLISILYTMENLPVNRLRCCDCRQYRLITEFPFDNRGCRLTCCTLCQARQARRRASKGKKGEMPESNTASSTGSTKVCTRCFVKHDFSLFGRFTTCKPCRVCSSAYFRHLYLYL